MSKKMNFKFFAVSAVALLAFAACDETTDMIGTSLTDNNDKLEVTADTFNVVTRSLKAGAVLSRNSIGYLGKIKDPETGLYITSNFMVQFHSLDDFHFPEKDSIVSTYNGEAAVDSAEIRLFYTTHYGDSLAPMKLIAYEMQQPMEEGVNYYSDFDPQKEGLVSADGYKVSKSYTLADKSIPDSEKGSDFMTHIRIPLNKPYTDDDGTTYNNYGTYILQRYYKDLEDNGKAESFSNAYRFIHDVVPGFYFQHAGGLGAMPAISVSQLNLYFRYRTLNSSGVDSIYTGTTSFAGTEEVLQTSTVTNSESVIEKLVEDNSCSYLKTPAGIFTEVTLPVEDIYRGHQKDNVNAAKIVFTRMNNNEQSDYSLDIPKTLLMIPKDSLYTFFEKGKNVDNQTAFYASYSSSYNNYTFSNISSLIEYMYEQKNSGNYSEDWNKAVLVPVTLTTTSDSYGTVITKVVHDMSLCSTRLTGGTNNPQAVKLSVIYSKFE